MHKKRKESASKPWEYYDGIAGGYDTLHREEQLEKLRAISQFIKPKKDDRMLDVGCGTCPTFDFFDCEVVGIEPSARMVNEYRMKTNAKPNVVIAPAEDVSKHFKGGYFDFIICMTAIHHFKGPEKVLRDLSLLGKSSAAFAFSLLKKAANTKRVESAIKGLFEVQEIFDCNNDTILICKQKKQKVFIV